MIRYLPTNSAKGGGVFNKDCHKQLKLNYLSHTNRLAMEMILRVITDFWDLLYNCIIIIFVYKILYTMLLPLGNAGRLRTSIPSNPPPAIGLPLTSSER